MTSRDVSLKMQVFPTVQRITEPRYLRGHVSGVGEDGNARCRAMDLGLYLRVTAKPRQRDSLHKPVVVDIEGPQRDGEFVTCDVLWSSSKDSFHSVVTGRFVREDGTPWSGIEVRAWPQIFPYSPGHRPHVKIPVGDAGRFRIVLDEPCPVGGRRIYRMHTVDDAGRIECRLDLSKTYPPGETDLGDVVLDRGALIVSGQVVDDTGQPLPKADVRVTQLVSGKRRDFWPEIDCSGRLVDAEGKFAIYAIPGKPLPARPLRLRVHCERMPSRRGIEFELGANGLRVVMRRQGSLHGSVALAEGQIAQDIKLTLRETTAVGGRARAHFMSLEPSGEFQQVVRPGSWQLVAELNTGNDSLRKTSRVEIDGIVIEPGRENRDPRAQGVAVAGLAPRIELRVVDEHDAPIQRASATVLGQRHSYPGLADSRGRVTIRPAVLPVDVEVSVYGYRKQTLRGIREDQRVVLRRGLAVKLTAEAKAIGKDPAYHLGFWLFHVDDKGRRRSMAWSGHMPYERMYFDDKGEARLMLPRPGTYELSPRIFLSGKDGVGTGGTVKQEEVLRFKVLEGEAEQTFRFRISAAALAETVRRYAR